MLRIIRVLDDLCATLGKRTWLFRCNSFHRKRLCKSLSSELLSVLRKNQRDFCATLDLAGITLAVSPCLLVTCEIVREMTFPSVAQKSKGILRNTEKGGLGLLFSFERFQTRNPADAQQNNGAIDSNGKWSDTEQEK